MHIDTKVESRSNRNGFSSDSISSDTPWLAVQWKHFPGSGSGWSIEPTFKGTTGVRVRRSYPRGLGSGIRDSKHGMAGLPAVSVPTVYCCWQPAVSVPTVYYCWLFLFVLPLVGGNLQAKMLYEDLFIRSGYNRLIRPVRNQTDTVHVKIALRLMQIIDVDEKNQIMTTNVWVDQEWYDPILQWNPDDHGGVEVMYVPAASIWHPDIVLYNTADGSYETATGTKAALHPSGRVLWHAPASYKSSCSIDVTYFPFDQQQCSMKFGSWTYNKDEVDITHAWQTDDETSSDEFATLESGIDVDGFYPNVEWDLMAVPARKSLHHYAGSTELFPEWTFNVTLRRQFLFYTVNLIGPLVSHACVTLLVFYLPGDSRQKIALCINILLSLTVFFLMLAEIIPPTSLVVPLLGKYLVFTMILVVTSVTVTVCTYNVYYRSLATHTMPDWARKIFLYILPRILRMRRPKIENSQDIQLKYIRINWCPCIGPSTAEGATRHTTADMRKMTPCSKTQVELLALSQQLDDAKISSRANLDMAPEVQSAISGATYVAQHLKQEDAFNRVKEDWKYIALVLDRIFLIVYSVVCFVGTASIILSAPMLYDWRDPIKPGFV
ncbi:Acetylcholine receptor subunit alpha-like 1 [Lamellibrachia satsuma]|nr:Acetylcholine receptor subunit alpha-like 1 [Lamellibrachia satsuma]